MTNDYIAHYGVKRRSGRYPWGSGDRPYQGDASKYIEKYKRKQTLLENRIENRHDKNTRKTIKLEAKAERLNQKANAIRRKGDKKHYKAVKKQLKSNNEIKEKLALEEEKKASKLLLKSDKLSNKAERIDRKIEKISRRENFRDSIDQKLIGRYQRLIDKGLSSEDLIAAGRNTI